MFDVYHRRRRINTIYCQATDNRRLGRSPRPLSQTTGTLKTQDWTVTDGFCRLRVKRLCHKWLRSLSLLLEILYLFTYRQFKKNVFDRLKRIVADVSGYSVFPERHIRSLFIGHSVP